MHIPGDMDPYDEMMDSLGDMVRCIVFARADHVTKELQSRMSCKDDTFRKSFIVIAGYSSQPGRSKKLLRALLSAFNANTVNRLKRVLSERQGLMDNSTPDSLRTCTDAALEYIEQKGTPFSLQRLSRLAIRRAMLTGTLNNESLASGILPVHLKEYVLRQE